MFVSMSGLNFQGLKIKDVGSYHFMNDNPFQIVFSGYDPAKESSRETLCTLGNGYFATRGAHESTRADSIHYPGTYLAGGYNRLKSELKGQVIENEDLVNWPNWLFLTFKIGKGVYFSPDTVHILSYSQTLDLSCGVLSCSMRFSDSEDHVTILETHRLVHMDLPHLAAIQWKLTPVNWYGEITIHSALQGDIVNCGVKRYCDLNNNHLRIINYGFHSNDGLFLEACTSQSKIRMSQAMRTRIYKNDILLQVERKFLESKGYCAHEMTFDCVPDETVQIEKIVSIYTSRDFAISEPVSASCEAVEYAGTYSDLYKSQVNSWKKLWDRFDIELSGLDQSQKLIRLHIFHVLQTASPNTYDLDVGIPSRGLHGEAYRGHIMWDELFFFPLLNFRNPLLTREFLLYRYHRLPQARLAARNAGFKGAMFPWQSGSDGREESQRIHLNPFSGHWIPDETYLQRHINAGIVYSIWQYFQVTDDRDFLYFFGAEIIFEIARFFSSLALFNPQRERYEIHGIIGPDEYHTRYPGSSQAGINNNAYTNFMASWVLLRALETIDLLDKRRRSELFIDLNIDEDEIERWKQISSRMFIPFTDDSIIDQFEGYHSLKELDWDYYWKNYGDNLRLDRIMEKEGDSINNYKASKQADILMLFYLFSSDEISEMFNHLGYQFDTGCIPSIIEYYSHRTSHGSTLSRLVFSWVLSRSDRKHSWNTFEHALSTDFLDIQGGTTAEGIHLAAMAGTVDMIQRCYTGLEVRENILYINPLLPDDLSEINQRIRYRSHWIDMQINRKSISLTFESGWGNPITVKIKDREFFFSDYCAITVPL